MKTSGLAHKPKQAISNIRGTPAAYESATVFENGAHQTYIVTHCIECQEETRIHWNTGGADPAFVERKFRGLGWHFDAHKPRRCVCPECLKGKKFVALIEAGAGAPSPTSAQEEPAIMPKSTPANSYVPPSTDTGVLTAVANLTAAGHYDRTLTTHEKARLRVILDGHFDDSVGRYLDNYDDKKVGQETDLPWALVAQYRELAYGPLKDDPNVAAVRAESAALRQEFIKLIENVKISQAAVLQAFDEHDAAIRRIEGRLINVEAKAKKL